MGEGNGKYPSDLSAISFRMTMGGFLRDLPSLCPAKPCRGYQSRQIVVQVCVEQRQREEHGNRAEPQAKGSGWGQVG